MTAASLAGVLRAMLARSSSVLALAALGCSSGAATTGGGGAGDGRRGATANAATSSGGPTTGFAVSGNRLLRDGEPFQLRGVNRSGSEYACIQDFGFFDGPSDDASIEAIAAWKANAVRIPLNEDCWLGINGAPAMYSGAAYRQAIADYVDRLNQHGLAAIVELHWSAAGTTPATKQDPMPNRDHSIAFWSDVAGAFADRPYVIFEPFNEPFPDSNQDTDAAWTCWRDGGTCPGASFEAAGMQELVTAIRDAGATQVILLGGVTYANSLSQWLAREPSDPLGRLGAAWHVYDFNACSDAACYDAQVAPVAAMVPLVTTEIGSDDCDNGAFIGELMGWLDARSQSYLAWTWDAWNGGCPVLVANYAGTPNGVYGQTYRDHLATF